MGTDMHFREHTGSKSKLTGYPTSSLLVQFRKEKSSITSVAFGAASIPSIWNQSLIWRMFDVVKAARLELRFRGQRLIVEAVIPTMNLILTGTWTNTAKKSAIVANACVNRAGDGVQKDVESSNSAAERRIGSAECAP